MLYVYDPYQVFDPAKVTLYHYFKTKKISLCICMYSILAIINNHRHVSRITEIIKFEMKRDLIE